MTTPLSDPHMPPSSLRGPMRMLAVVAATLLVAAACGVNPQPTDYGEQYEENFMLGCTGRDDEGEIPNGGSVLAGQEACECIYDGLVDKIPFDEAKEFEETQAEAEDGADIDVPDNIQAIFDDCGAPS